MYLFGVLRIHQYRDPNKILIEKTIQKNQHQYNLKERKFTLTAQLLEKYGQLTCFVHPINDISAMDFDCY